MTVILLMEKFILCTPRCARLSRIAHVGKKVTVKVTMQQATKSHTEG